jgi:hypothetical protein
MFMVRDKLYSKQEVDGITQFRPKESEWPRSGFSSSDEKEVL